VPRPPPRSVRPAAPGAYAAVRDLLRRPQPPTALISATDRAAIDGIWAAHDLGVAVPDQLAVIGTGNIPEGLMISPPLTTVGAAALDFSREVARLFARLDAPTPFPGTELTAAWKLIARASG
jgi:DNA-binding LacI/PurR family transcriptional regulator